MDDPESCTSVDTVTVPVVCASLGINKESSFLEVGLQNPTQVQLKMFCLQTLVHELLYFLNKF